MYDMVFVSADKNAREKIISNTFEIHHKYWLQENKNVTWLPITAAVPVRFAFVIETNSTNWPFK